MGRIVGIDLGTTNSLVAYVDAQTGQPKCVTGPYGSALCPSVVSLDPDGSVIVGEAARRRLRILLREARPAIRSIRILLPAVRGAPAACARLPCACLPVQADTRRGRRVAKDAVGVVELGTALQRNFFFAFGQIHKNVGVQFPTQLQKFLLECIHAQPQPAMQAKKSEVPLRWAAAGFSRTRDKMPRLPEHGSSARKGGERSFGCVHR